VSFGGDRKGGYMTVNLSFANHSSHCENGGISVLGVGWCRAEQANLCCGGSTGIFGWGFECDTEDLTVRSI
jgi:hypothetical protein